MKTYEFTLKFKLPDECSPGDVDALIEVLCEAGCDDALVGSGRAGRLGMDFSREAKSAFAAIQSAIKAVKQAIPGARVVEAAPDLVGLTEIAGILGCSRQNVRKLMLASGASFPAPVHEGKSALWHLSSVLNWLRDSRAYEVDEELLEVAAITMAINAARDFGAFDSARQTRLLALVS